MSATVDWIVHDFIHCDRPTPRGAGLVQWFVEEHADGHWAHVFCVTNGHVQWSWSPSIYGDGGKRHLRYCYDVEEMPKMAEATGYLVQHYSQSRDPTHEEVDEAATEAKASYKALADYLARFW